MVDQKPFCFYYYLFINLTQTHTSRSVTMADCTRAFVKDEKNYGFTNQVGKDSQTAFA